MNKYIKENIINIIIICVTITLVALLYAQNISFTKKLEEQEQKTIILEEVAKQQSDIEILWEAANVAATDAKSRLEVIEGLKIQLKTQEEAYEYQLLTQKCFESQIYRLTGNLEYNLEYCKDWANLEQFRTKKY